MSNIINDGGVVGFTRVVTISAVAYTLDDFKFDIPTGTDFTRTDNNSIPTGQAFAIGVTTGSATAQLATAATALPPWGGTFAVAEGTMIITQVGRAETKDGETKVPITFKKAITGSIVAT